MPGGAAPRPGLPRPPRLQPWRKGVRLRQPDQSPVGWAGCAQLCEAQTPAFQGFFKAMLRLVPIVKKKWGPDLRSVTLFPLKKLLDTRAPSLGQFAVAQEGSNAQGGADMSWRCQDLHTHTCAHADVSGHGESTRHGGRSWHPMPLGVPGRGSGEPQCPSSLHNPLPWLLPSLTATRGHWWHVVAPPGGACLPP